VSKITTSDISSNIKLLSIPSLQIYGFELAEHLSKEMIDSLVKWSNAFESRIIQFFDGERIISKKQLEVGFARALRSADQKKMIAKNIEVELALWISGTRLIQTAFEKVGMSSKTKYLLVASVNKDDSNTKVPDNYFSELQNNLPESQPWTYKKPTNIGFLAEVYEIDLKPLDSNIKLDDLEKYILQKVTLLTVSL